MATVIQWKWVYAEGMATLEELLDEVCEERYTANIVISPIGKVMDRKFKRRLTLLRHKIESLTLEQKHILEFNTWASICSVLYHCNFDL